MLKGTSKNERVNISVLCREMENVDENESNPIEIWFNWGRFEHRIKLNILLDKDKLVALWNESCPVLNDCRLGRFILK